MKRRTPTYLRGPSFKCGALKKRRKKRGKTPTYPQLRFSGRGERRKGPAEEAREKEKSRKLSPTKTLASENIENEKTNSEQNREVTTVMLSFPFPPRPLQSRLGPSRPDPAPPVHSRFASGPAALTPASPRQASPSALRSNLAP